MNLTIIACFFSSYYILGEHLRHNDHDMVSFELMAVFMQDWISAFQPRSFGFIASYQLSLFDRQHPSTF